MFADLHIHTDFSDGSNTVLEVFTNAIQNNVSVISITDHNTVEAYQDAQKLDMAMQNKVKLLTGVELDVIHNQQQFHLLGYKVDVNNPTLLEVCKYNTDVQENHNLNLLRQMEKSKYAVSESDYVKYSIPKGRGGWKLLNYLLDIGITTSLLEGTKYYREFGFDSNQLSFVPLIEAVKIIKSVSGVPVLAHPAEQIWYDDDDASKTAFYHTIESILETGVKGIECLHPLHRFDLEEELVAFCRARKLYITGGSDYHGSFFNKQKQKIGGQLISTKLVNKTIFGTADN